MPIKLNPIWGSKRMTVLDGRQVRCTTFDEGSVWIHRLDNLPPLVRRRLANSRFNLCPTCVEIDTRRNGTPSLRLYFRVIELNACSSERNNTTIAAEITNGPARVVSLAEPSEGRALGARRSTSHPSGGDELDPIPGAPAAPVWDTEERPRPPSPRTGILSKTRIRTRVVAASALP